MALQKLKVLSVREAFVQELENKILSGEFAVGDKLPTSRELCTLMGVSLTIVNAGISELAAKGFVEIKPRHGVYVADYRTNGTTETMVAVMRYNGGKLNSREVRSFCESRVALDPFVAQLVIERATDEGLKRLEPYAEAIRSVRELDDFCTAVLGFFKTLYMLSENTIFTLLYNSTMEPQRGMYAVFIEKNGFDIVADYMLRIYDGIIKRDTETVKALLIESMNLPLSGNTSIV